ncbi:PREDICTED: tetratricopeptide repeat protein GNN isoform X2 [Cercocebus atys]|uniref:tetratricopeptide repeat protein GNN isoform X2 n=1 Tax=Cercocebus atys TaxID=9531 RepID=UPI0005F4DFFB|nr:PREDICTED: tetratricopeptide repeat protein GNN isoform X2 [Cercocebus atys]
MHSVVPKQREMSQKTNENVQRYTQFLQKPQKPIQPYICSTLNDFQEERDFLANNIFPQLNELCNSRGTYFKAVDLNWSELKAPKSLPTHLFRQYSCLQSQHLKLCLDYVNSCFPFFICMLGQTYGDFLPDYSHFMTSKVTRLSSLSKVEQNLYVAAKNGYPWVLENPNCSLTEFEIIQAAFLNESQFQYFYFRTGTTLLKASDDEEKGERLPSSSSTNEEEKLRIGKLKAKIISKGLPVRFYSGLHELGELVFKDWSVVIEKLHPATLMIENIGTQLETDILNEDSDDLVFSLLVEVFIASISLKPCILVLDGIEELIGIYGISGQKAKDFSWLPHSLSPHCKFIMTTVSSSLSYKSLCARPDVRTVELISTGDEETKLNIFRKHLSIPNMDPFQHSRQSLRKKPELSPLKLTILANELKECRIYRNEFHCMKEYLEAVSVQELWELVLKRWIEDYSWTFQPKRSNSDTVASGEGLDGWVADALCLLCLSHGGLAEDELLQLLDMLGYRNHCKVATLHWAAFRNATKQWVQEKPNGLLYFWHQSLRSAVEHKLLGVIAPVRESSPCSFQSPINHKKTYFHQVLIRYFQRQTSFWRVYQELPWHMKMSGCLQGLCGFLSSPSIIDFISKIQSPGFWTRLHLIHFWNVLLEAGYDVSEAYLLSAAKIKADQCHTMRKSCILSVLQCRLIELTVPDKCRLMFFIGSFLKFMGKTSEAEELLLSVEDMLVQSQSMTDMLLKVQNAIGELYLETGMTQEGFQYFQKAWSSMLRLSLSDLEDSRDLVKQKVRVLNNLAKSASEEYLKENHILEYATEISNLLDNNPRNQATMKYIEGVLMFVAGNTSLAKMKLQECLNIRKSLFGKKNMLVGEVMEFLADLLFFPQRDSKKSQRKQVLKYYKQVIKIKENAETLAKSSLLRKQLNISLSDTLCKLAGQLLASDSCHHVMIEAVGYLYRSLDLRVIHLGSSHSSIHGILHLLREIEWIRSRRCWPQGMSQQHSEGSRNGFSLWEHLLKLNYHSAQSSHTVSSAMCMNADKLHRARRMDLAPQTISDKSKCAAGKGKKKPIICVSAEEKIQRKTQNHAEIWNDSGKEASNKKKDYSSNILSLGKMNGLIKLSRQRILLAKSESGEGEITANYHHSLPRPLSTKNPWEYELISEKWLFHSPDYISISQKSFLQRRFHTETKLLKTSDDINKE